jgi:hypothetical protein
LSEDPRWRLECRRRQHELCKSKILLRCCNHTWQKKSTKKNQNFDTLNHQPVQSFSMPHYTEKQEGSCGARRWLQIYLEDIWQTNSRELADGSLTLPQKRGAKQRNKPPINQHSENPTPKQDSWWATELISRP